MHLNVEIKARSVQHEYIGALLVNRNADYKGCDHQVDTYFHTQNGRLKIRRGEIENALVYYERENQEGPKQSNVVLVQQPPTSLDTLLEKALGILVRVEKEREIYFINNVKFHLDKVKDLGTFVEIEAIDLDDTIGHTMLLQQCSEYMELFGIEKKDLINCSYSDLLLQKR